MNGHAVPQTPRVSVVMSVYNGERYLRESIDSILNQTFTDYELILVDDASADGTPHILDEYTDRRVVRAVNPSNLGLAGSLNRGLAMARGSYIARQDADDISHRERLAAQVAYLDAHQEVGAVTATVQWIDGRGEPVKVWRQPTDGGAIQETLLVYCCLVHGSALYRREAALEIGGYDAQLHTGQDYDFWLRMSEGWDLACLPEVLYEYRCHAGMVSRERHAEQARNADLARARAVRRRLDWAWLSLGIQPEGAPLRLRQMSRRRLAARYVSWSAGARETSRGAALAFLLAAFAFCPVHPRLWAYVRGILARKILGLVKGRPSDKLP